MNRRPFKAVCALGLLALFASPAQATAAGTGASPSWYDPGQAMPDFETKKFAGEWFEIARYRELDEAFSRNVRSTYTYLSPSTMHEVSEFDIGPVPSRTEASLFAPDPKIPGALFAKHETLGYVRYAPFNVIAAGGPDGRDYAWALIGEPTRHKLHVLSRGPFLDADILSMIVDKLENELDYKNAGKHLQCTPQPRDINRICDWFLQQLNG